MKAYKCFTRELRSPIQGGDPVWDGELPFDLPLREVDRSNEECAAGWNACAEAHDALRIAGLWPDGRPSRVFEVEGDPIVRGDTLRAATWTITRELTETEIGEAVLRLSEDAFDGFAEEMTREQMAWRAALARPRHDGVAIETGLRAALAARGLKWTLRRFNTTGEAWEAWEAWVEREACVVERDARVAWKAWKAWDARVAWDAWVAMATWTAWDARDARGARDARDAWAAGDALTAYYVAKQGWVKHAPDLLTVGLRDAYAAGLEIALPVGPNELGWAM